MRRFIIIAVGIATLAVLANSRVGETLEKVKFLIPTSVNQVYYGFASVPGKEGWFQKEGLQVEIEGTKGSTNVTKLVAAGHAQIGYIGVEPAAIGRQPSINMNVQVVALEARSNVYWVGVPSDTGPRDLKGLRGKRIGVWSLGSGAVPAILAQMEEMGVGPKEFELVATGFYAQSAAALRTGKVSGLAFWDTAFATMENMGLKMRYLTSPGSRGLYGSAFVANGDWIRNHPGQVIRLLRAMNKSFVLQQANPERYVRDFWALYPGRKPKKVDDATALRYDKNIIGMRVRSLRKVGTKTIKWGEMSDAGWKRVIDFLAKTGKFFNDTATTEIYTNKFIDKSNDFDEAAMAASLK
jgi:NitT/TauT family transport system substrate-binding protein